VKKIDENMEWKKEAPYLASLPRTMPYGVPENYFNELSKNINQTVFLTSFSAKENQGFNVPENYFEILTSQIETNIALQKINLKDDGFSIPSNYFENLQAKIVAKTNAKPTKIIRLWASDFNKYAAAACVILISAFTLFLNQQAEINTKNDAELANEQMLYGIDESVIIEHIQEKSTVSNTDTDLENYILNNFSTRDISNNL
jgi:hypothetical protein